MAAQMIRLNTEDFSTSLLQQQAEARLLEKLHLEEIERKKLFDALIQSEKLAALGRVAAVIAHEINNPLEAVANAIYLVSMQPGLPEDARLFLNLADAELQRIAAITRQTLGVCRETPGITTFSLASLIDSVAYLLRSKIAEKQAAVESEVDNTIHISASFGELRQVILNLASNSLDAVAVGGRLRLRAVVRSHPKTGAKKIRLTISDNGVGIAPAVLPRIFDPFFTTKGALGNGLGLWITREIVRNHGGLLLCRSSTRGNHRGTTFSAIVPEQAA